MVLYVPAGTGREGAGLSNVQGGLGRPTIISESHVRTEFSISPLAIMLFRLGLRSIRLFSQRANSVCARGERELEL